MNNEKNDSPNIAKFQQKIFTWWNKNKRELPWRETTDPYLIMVSEIMLQQTQTFRVVPKYLKFIEKFPTVKSLANASKTEILELWSGLGYNRRSLWLQEAAKSIVSKGEFPQTPEELIKLKGIGKYTAKSILIFAFNLDIATVDTNIRRIFIKEKFATEETSEKELFEIANILLPRGKSRDWHNALMDYGAVFLTSRKTGISPTSKQSKFKDSTREKRGQILKYILNSKDVSLEELKSVFSLKRKQLDEILKKMVKEGLLHETNGIYNIE